MGPTLVCRLQEPSLEGTLMTNSSFMGTLDLKQLKAEVVHFWGVWARLWRIPMYIYIYTHTCVCVRIHMVTPLNTRLF